MRAIETINETTFKGKETETELFNRIKSFHKKYLGEPIRITVEKINGKIKVGLEHLENRNVITDFQETFGDKAYIKIPVGV